MQEASMDHNSCSSKRRRWVLRSAASCSRVREPNSKSAQTLQKVEQYWSSALLATRSSAPRYLQPANCPRRCSNCATLRSNSRRSLKVSSRSRYSCCELRRRRCSSPSASTRWTTSKSASSASSGRDPFPPIQIQPPSPYITYSTHPPHPHARTHLRRPPHRPPPGKGGLRRLPAQHPPVRLRGPPIHQNHLRTPARGRRTQGEDPRPTRRRLLPRREREPRAAGVGPALRPPAAPHQQERTRATPLRHHLQEDLRDPAGPQDRHHPRLRGADRGTDPRRPEHDQTVSLRGADRAGGVHRRHRLYPGQAAHPHPPGRQASRGESAGDPAEDGEIAPRADAGRNRDPQGAQDGGHQQTHGAATAHQPGGPVQHLHDAGQHLLQRTGQGRHRRQGAHQGHLHLPHQPQQTRPRSRSPPPLLTRPAQPGKNRDSRTLPLRQHRTAARRRERHRAQRSPTDRQPGREPQGQRPGRQDREETGRHQEHREEVHRRDPPGHPLDPLIPPPNPHHTHHTHTAPSTQHSHQSIHSKRSIFMRSSSPCFHSPSLRLPTSSCRMSTSFPSSEPTFGTVLPRSPCTNSLMQVPALAQTSRTAERVLTRWRRRRWMTFWRFMRVLRWSTRSGVSCCSGRSETASRTALSCSPSGCSAWMQQRQCLIFSVSAALSSTLMKDSVVSCNSSTCTYWLLWFTNSYSIFAKRQEWWVCCSPYHAANAPRSYSLDSHGASAKAYSTVTPATERMGFTNSSTKGRPPVSMRTSMSSLPPEWKRISTSSFLRPGQKSGKMRSSISSCRLPSVSFRPPTTHGVCDRYRENFMYLPQRQTLRVSRTTLCVTAGEAGNSLPVANWQKSVRVLRGRRMESNSGCLSCAILLRLWALQRYS